MSRTVARALVVLACSLGLCGVGGFAVQSRLDRLPPEWRAAIVAYGLTVVDRAPVGVRPITVTSLSDLQQAMEAIRAPRTQVASDPATDTSLVMTLSGGTICRRYHWADSGAFFFSFNLDATVYVSNYGSFTWIDHMGNVRVYLSGFHLGAALTDPWTESYIGPDNAQCAWISGGGTIEYYIVFQGILTVWASPEALYEYINVVAR